MDKVKVVLAFLKKYHFWALCLLIIVFGMVVWNLASADLTNQYTKRKSRLDSVLNSSRAIASETNHPNNKTNQSLAKLNAEQRQKVHKAWKALYEKQKKHNPWPKPPILSEDFLKHEKSNEEIEPEYREMYGYFIHKYIPTLFKIVDYRHLEESEGEKDADAVKRSPRTIRIMGDKASKNQRLVGIVEWDKSNRERISKSYNSWLRAPTTIQLRMAQEDIWVYEALLRIIRDTNKGATSHYNASIKRIAALEIGQDAAAEVSSGGADLMAAVQGGSGGSSHSAGMGGFGMGGPEGGFGMDGPEMGRFGRDGPAMGFGRDGPEMGRFSRDGPAMGGGMGGDMGGSSLSATDQAVLNKRYVDQNKKPLSAASPPPFAEFKMMPIRMSLGMDRRKIPKLLVECANSTMPVEVQRIRINPQGGLGLGSGGRGRLDGGGITTPGFGMGRRSDQTEEVNPQEVSVEIVGIIYIYNPPDPEKVGTGTAREDDQAMPGAPTAPAAPGTTTAPAAPPAAVPPRAAPAKPRGA